MTILLLGLALVVLHRELKQYRYAEIVNAVREIPRMAIALSLAFTVVAYIILTGYDAIALRYVGQPLPYRRVAFSSCIAYGLSQTLGFPLVTGGAVRYRFWSAWGLANAEIAQAAAFVGATFTVGVITISGAALLLEPEDTLALLRLPDALARTAGLVLLLAVAVYLLWSFVRRGQPMRIRNWEFPVPSPQLTIAQVILATADWCAAGAVLYVLLPGRTEIGFLPYLGIFVLAQFAGVLSNVPGGLGVFETLILLLLGPHVAADQTLAALLAYRVIYYLLPFGAALLLLAGHEILHHGWRLVAAANSTTDFITRWGPTVLPTVLSATTFLAGGVLLLSGATPSVHKRVAALDRVIPLGFIEFSHFAASMAGAALVVLAWAIYRRLDAAYALTIIVLCVGIVASLLKGLDYEEALFLGVVLSAVIPSREAFYRRAALTSEPFTPGWVVAVVAVIGATIWLGLFSFKHVEYSSELWWRFTVRGDAPRFLRATSGAVGVLLAVGLARLLRHAEADPTAPTLSELERAHRIVSQSRETTANLALLGDKALLFADGDDGLIMYGVEGRSWIALGDPVGPPATRIELAWRFREEADRHGAWPVFYQVSAATLPLYVDLGLTLHKLGEEARVELAGFSLEGGDRKGLRRTMKDVAKLGFTFQVVPPDAVPALLPELRRVSNSWLAEKNSREKGFSLGRFDERYLSYFPMALVSGPIDVGDDSGERGIVAFANLWTSAGCEELSVDLMRYTPDAPKGVMDYLFVELLLWGRAGGYNWFNLGMAPFSGIQGRPLASNWNRLGGLIYRHGEHFYNFQGLRQYKEKFNPVWESRYLASPGGLVLPRILTNVTSLISGGLTGVVKK